MINTINPDRFVKQECKYCGQSIGDRISGLRDFCSEAHRKLFRNKYQAELMKGRRFANISEKTTLPTDPLDVSKSNLTVSTVYKTANEESETFESYGNKDWYDMAKKLCCNFEVREREGYCITLTEPYQRYRKACSECSLGRALRDKHEEDDNKAKSRFSFRRRGK